MHWTAGGLKNEMAPARHFRAVPGIGQSDVQRAPGERPFPKMTWMTDELQGGRLRTFNARGKFCGAILVARRPIAFNF